MGRIDMQDLSNQKVEYLYQIRQELEDVAQLKKKLSVCMEREKAMKRGLASDQKSIQEEIDRRIQMRRQELEQAYDAQLQSNKGKRKNVMQKREQTKKRRMEERMSLETEDLTRENEELHAEMKKLFRAGKLPDFCMSFWFYAVFLPSKPKEYLAFLGYLLAAYAGIPALVYQLSAKVLFQASANRTPLCAFLTSLTVFLSGLVYVCLQNRWKVGKYDILLRGRELQEQIHENEKEIGQIRSDISKDQDDSMYGLEKYDDKLTELEDQWSEIGQEKKRALSEFEEAAREQVTQEVGEESAGALNQRREELEYLETQHEEIETEIRNSEQRIRDVYGSELGAQFCKEDALDDLISLIEDGTAENVADAIAAYRGVGR